MFDVHSSKFAVLGSPPPVTALAPMQDVTTLPFMKLLGRYGAPDLLFTEYFRVHAHSTLEQHIVDSICLNGTGRPVFAQMIGESLPDLQRTVRAMHDAELPLAGIDLKWLPPPKCTKRMLAEGYATPPRSTRSSACAK